jgi:hypothetical protein
MAVGLQLARQRGDIHEEALTLDGLLALGSVTGTRRDERHRARRELFERLGMIESPQFRTEAASVEA